MVDFLFGQGNAPCEYEWKGEHKVVLAVDTSYFGYNAQCIKVLYQLKIVCYVSGKTSVYFSQYCKGYM